MALLTKPYPETVLTPSSDFIEFYGVIALKIGSFLREINEPGQVLPKSLNVSIRSEKFNKLIAVYHEHLEIFLKRLNYSEIIPTLAEFQQQFVDKMFYGLLNRIFSWNLFTNIINYFYAP